MHLIEWLLSDNAVAAEVRRRQQVLVMPVNNPDSFFVTDRFGNANGIDPYTGSGHWDIEGPRFTDPDKAPEVMAVLRVVDRFKPDVHVDLHGTRPASRSAIGRGLPTPSRISRSKCPPTSPPRMICSR